MEVPFESIEQMTKVFREDASDMDKRIEQLHKRWSVGVPVLLAISSPSIAIDAINGNLTPINGDCN